MSGFVKTLYDALDESQLRDPARVQLRIVEAYAAALTGTGSEVDAGIMLVDLAITTRYYDTEMFTVPADQVKAFDARRGVFQRVLEALTKAEMEPRGLHTAVLRSAPIYANEEFQE